MKATPTQSYEPLAARKKLRILFVCHGNICRSPMAEFVMKDMIERAGLNASFEVASAATSSEELGNDVDYGTRRILDLHGIPYEPRRARRIVSSEAENWDLLIGMDDANLRNMRKVFGPTASGKLYKLLEFAGRTEDVADPWYTGDFETTFEDVSDGCVGLLGFCRRAL